MLVFALPAFANSPNPSSGTIDQVTVNMNGSRTVTAHGTWTWPATGPSSEGNCPADRNGVGYQVVWFDNTANPIGQNNSPDGILYVGDSTDNIVHSLETLGGSSVIGNAFYDGVPSSYLTHNTTSPAPTMTDAGNWFSNCGTTNSNGSSGTWGPITHTYAPSFTGPIKLCPVMYDPHGQGVDKGGGGSGMGDITAGGNGHNGDNSYEGNGQGTNGNVCPTATIPTLTTSASSARAFGGDVSDTATLTGATGSGTITFKLYPSSANCTGTPLYSKSVATTGSGDYGSGGFAPSSSGTYQWQASYSSASIKGILTSCSDPSEKSSVPHQTLHPKAAVYAGYADGFRMGGVDAPSPWSGSPGVTFEGCNFYHPDRCPKNTSGHNIYDSSAVRLVNDTKKTETLTKASVVIGSKCTFRPWPGLKVTLAPGKQLILAQTGGPAPTGCHGEGKYNFDGSDTNKSCTQNDHLIPVLHVSIDGNAQAYRDTSRILNTGGVDLGGVACGKKKETHQWGKMAGPI